MADEIGSESPNPEVSGTIRFLCCGRNHKATGYPLILLTCPICSSSYNLHLVRRLPVPGKYPPHTPVCMTDDYTTNLSQQLAYTIPKGTKMRVGYDSSGFLACPEDHTLLEIPITLNGRQLPLLVPVPNSKFEEDHNVQH